MRIAEEKGLEVSITVDTILRAQFQVAALRRYRVGGQEQQLFLLDVIKSNER